MEDETDIEEPQPGRLGRFIIWRRTSGSWTWSCLALSWLGLTAGVVELWALPWPVYLISASVFVLLFEVGLAYVIGAGWSSHRQLEFEGDQENEEAQEDEEAMIDPGGDSG